MRDGPGRRGSRGRACFCASQLLCLALALPAAAEGPAPAAKATLFSKIPTTEKARMIADAVQQVIAARKDLSLVKIEALLDPVAPREGEVDSAAKKLAEGEKQTSNLEIEKGKVTLGTVVSTMEQHFDVVARDPKRVASYVRALTSLALAQFLAGDKSATSETLFRAYIVDPKIDYDKTRFPPPMKQLFDQVHFLANELGTGRVKVSSAPPAAYVRVNGKIVGHTPVVPRGLTVGRNLVTLSKLGYRTRTFPINVTGGSKVASLKKTLEPLPGRPVQLLEGALKEALSGSAGSGLKSAAARIDVERLLLLRLRGQGDTLEAELVAYDAGSGELIGRSKGKISTYLVDEESKALVNGLFLSVKQQAAAAKRAQQKRPSFFSRVYRSKYFWPVVGAVLGAAAVGTAVGIIAVTASRSDRRREILPILPLVTFR